MQVYPSIKKYFKNLIASKAVLTDASINLVSGDSFVAGMILLWSGTIATIPSGWHLCNGSDGTPDLRDKFVVGAKQDDAGAAKTNLTGALTQSGGSVTIAEANLPSHTHGVGTIAAANESAHTHTGGAHTHGAGTYGAASAGAHTHTMTKAGNAGGGTDYIAGDYLSNSAPNAAGATGSDGAHTHTISGDSASGGAVATGAGSAHTHALSGSTAAVGSGTAYAQPYYALAYIMKV